MKGWIYVISNKAMPNLIKVGHSTKDPQLRAQELDHTGAPHPYLVEYEMLIEEPSKLERQVHKVLSSVHERKEWFRCTAEEAIAAIQLAAGGRAINESFKRAERHKVEGIRQQRDAAQTERRVDEERRRTLSYHPVQISGSTSADPDTRNSQLDGTTDESKRFTFVLHGLGVSFMLLFVAASVVDGHLRGTLGKLTFVVGAVWFTWLCTGFIRPLIEDWKRK
jgi:T5orf172 domain